MSEYDKKPGKSIEAFGPYDFVHNTRKYPIGLKLGAKVTADLAIGLPEFDVMQYFGTQPTIYNDYDHVVTAYNRKNGRVIGLLGGCWLGNDDIQFFYLWTMMVADEFRNTRVTKGMLAYFIQQLVEEEGIESFPRYVVTKTYNPIVYSLLDSVAFPHLGIKLYPQIPACAQEISQTELAERIAVAISPRLVLDGDSGTVLGGQAMVAPDFFPRMEMSRSEDVNSHFKAHLSTDDQILCILDIPKTSRPDFIDVMSINRRRKKMTMEAPGKKKNLNITAIES